MVLGQVRGIRPFLRPEGSGWKLAAWVSSVAVVAALTVAAPGAAFAVGNAATESTAAPDVETSDDSALATGEPLRYDCIDSWEPRTLNVPDNVVAYEVVATAGSGTHGHNDTEGGVGAQVKGTLNVEGVTSLDLWVGCGGYDFDGAGYGHRGGGGGGGGHSITGTDGGDGGGASMIAISSPFTPLVAAGGGGGSGGRGESDDGGMGGSGGGVNHTKWWYDGRSGTDGGDGGKANSHTSHGQPSPDGGSGGHSGFGSGGGGGGGAGYPSGGGGGHGTNGGGGGGGGAGGSYLSSQRVTDPSITVAPEYGSGHILLTPVLRTTTDLIVKKVVAGAAGSFAKGPFTVEASCALNGAPLFTKSVNLGPDGSHTFSGVDAGAVCAVSETRTGAASTPAPPQTVTVGATPTTVTLTNEFAAGSFDVSVASKVVGEDGAPDSDVKLTLGDLGVHVSCTLAGQPIVLPTPVSGGHLTYTGEDTWADGGQTLTVDGVPVNSECSVVQAAGSGATTVGYAVDGTTVAGEQASFTVGASKTSVLVTDSYQLAPLSVTKAADGSGIPLPGVYSGTVSCTFQGQPVTLPATAMFHLAIDESALVHGLPIGAKCTVTETDAGDAVASSYTPSQTVLITAEPVPAVTVTNTFDDGALTVSVNASGAGAGWANVAPVAQVVCTVGADTILDETVSSGVSTFKVDDGAVCSATETVSGGADSVWYASSSDTTPSAGPVSVTVAPDGPVTLTADNVFTAAPLSVSTSTTGEGAEYASRPTTVTVSECTFNDLPIEITPGVTSVELTLPAQGGTASVPELPTGAGCSVVETDAAGATSTTSSSVNADPASELPAGGQRVTVNQPADEVSTSVAFVNQFDVAALSVGKSVAGEAAWASNEPFEVQVSCTWLGEPVSRLGVDGVGAVEFEPDGTVDSGHAVDVLTTLSVGSECSATESVTGAATTVAYVPVGADETRSGTVTVIDGGASIVVTNTFEASELTVSKIVAGNDADNHAEDVFHFDAACTFNGKLLPVLSGGPDGSGVFTLTAGGSHVFSGLPVGAVCDVNEFGDQHATEVTPSRDQEVTLTAGPAALTFTNTFEVAPVTVDEVLTGAGADTYGSGQVFVAQVECFRPNDLNERVVLPDGGEVELSAGNGFAVTLNAPIGTECSVSQGLQMATHQVLPDPVTILAGERHALPIGSEFVVEPVTVSKTALGEFSPQQEFGFETSCVWVEDGHAVGLPLNEHAPGAFSLRSGQEHTVEALVGAQCSVTETDAAGAIRTVVDVHGTDAHVSAKTATFTIGSGVATLAAFTNYLPGAIPVTGVEAAWALAIALLLILGGGAALLLYRRRRQA